MKKIGEKKCCLNKDGYATIHIGGRTTMLLHRFLMNATIKSLPMDHKNHDMLDNRKTNLHFVTAALNAQRHKQQVNILVFSGTIEIKIGELHAAPLSSEVLKLQNGLHTLMIKKRLNYLGQKHKLMEFLNQQIS